MIDWEVRSSCAMEIKPHATGSPKAMFHSFTDFGPFSLLLYLWIYFTIPGNLRSFKFSYFITMVHFPTEIYTQFTKSGTSCFVSYSNWYYLQFSSCFFKNSTNPFHSPPLIPVGVPLLLYTNQVPGKKGRQTPENQWNKKCFKLRDSFPISLTGWFRSIWGSWDQ